MRIAECQQARAAGKALPTAATHRGSRSHVKTDVAVIGAGTAGLAAYRAAKAAGRAALLIEGGVHGTTCARVGCMPSKLLIAPAEAAHAVERFGAFGLRGDVSVDGEAVMARVRRERDRFVGFVLAGRGGDPGRRQARRLCALRRRQRRSPSATHAVDVSRDGHRDRLVAGVSRRVERAGRSARHQRRRVRVDRPARERGRVRTRRHRARARPGAASARRARQGVRPRRRRRAAVAIPSSIAEARRAFGAEFYLDTDAHADVSLDAASASPCATVRCDGETRTEHFDYLLAATGRTPNVAQARSRAHVGRARRTRRAAVRPRDDAMRNVADLHRRRCERRRSAAARSGGRRAASPATTPRAFPMCMRGCGAPRCRSCSPIRRSPSSAAAGAARATRRIVTGSVSFDDQGRARVMQRNRGRLHVYAEIAHRPAARRGNDRSRCRAPRASARVGAQLDLTIGRNAEAAVLPPGGRGRPAHRAARRVCATRRRRACAARRVTCDQRR